MGYKTQIIDDKKAKRDQLAKQMDNFSTFKWRGESAFDKFGMFIIAEKRGDLKFYNGPSFSNEYSKPQFAASSGDLLGVTFNRQQVAFKVGMYYFSIDEWQDFIEWINAYEVNYLTFMYAPKYGYLVKLAKMEDTPRYIVGYSNRKPMYYTEMTLTWDLQGDNCVRSNSPYEWDYSESDGTFRFNNSPDVNSNTSRLATPMLLTIPLSFELEKCQLSLLDHQQNVLFDVSLKNCPINEESLLLLTHCEVKKNISFTDISDIYEPAGFTSNNEHFIGIYIDTNTITYVRTDTITYDGVVVYSQGVWENDEYRFIKFDEPTAVPKYLMKYLNILDPNLLYKQNIFYIYPTLQYDSETGVLLYTAGDTSWKLLHLNMVDNEGNYMIENLLVNKYKLKGNISQYTFTLNMNGVKTSISPIMQIYERTNVI